MSTLSGNNIGLSLCCKYSSFPLTVAASSSSVDVEYFFGRFQCFMSLTVQQALVISVFWLEEVSPRHSPLPSGLLSAHFK